MQYRHGYREGDQKRLRDLIIAQDECCEQRLVLFQVVQGLFPNVTDYDRMRVVSAIEEMIDAKIAARSALTPSPLPQQP